MLDERSVQKVSTPFNIFKDKENVESMLNESLNHLQLKIKYTRFCALAGLLFTKKNHYFNV